MRASPPLALVLCCCLALALACGKYGRPQRISDSGSEVATAEAALPASSDAVESADDDGEEKSMGVKP